jgi:hypothetical protein
MSLVVAVLVHSSRLGWERDCGLLQTLLLRDISCWCCSWTQFSMFSHIVRAPYETSIRYSLTLFFSKILWRWYVNTFVVFLDRVTHTHTHTHTTFRWLDSVSFYRWRLLNSAQLIELSLYPLTPHIIGYINQARHEPSARVKTKIKTLKKFHTHEALHLWSCTLSRLLLLKSE